MQEIKRCTTLIRNFLQKTKLQMNTNYENNCGNVKLTFNINYFVIVHSIIKIWDGFFFNLSYLKVFLFVSLMYKKSENLIVDYMLELFVTLFSKSNGLNFPFIPFPGVTFINFLSCQKKFFMKKFKYKTES